MNLKHWLDAVINDVGALIIKRKDQIDLVLISLDEYTVETNYLLSGKNRDILLRSINEVKKGNKEDQELIEE